MPHRPKTHKEGHRPPAAARTSLVHGPLTRLGQRTLCQRRAHAASLLSLSSASATLAHADVPCFFTASFSRVSCNKEAVNKVVTGGNGGEGTGEEGSQARGGEETVRVKGANRVARVTTV